MMKRKLISIFLSLLIILMIIPTFAFQTAAADYATGLTGKGFPASYISALTALHTKYPNWKFEPLKVGKTFASSVAAERKSHSQQLIQVYSGNNGLGYYCTCAKCYKNGNYVVQEGTNWVSASEKAVQYYMDPRNFLDEQHIFQFESTLYNASQTQAGVETILKGTWMYNANITYKDKNGKAVTYSPATKYSKAIMDAAKASKLSPYYLASKIVQEVGGTKASAGGASGTYKGYEGIYNYYNIGANTGATDGLKWASFTPTGAHVQTSSGVSVNLRQSPVNGSIIASIPSGTAVKTYSLTAKQSDGYQWVKLTNVTVGGKTYNGYIRADYFVENAKDTYNRPWTNPYLSIYNGAKWIANNFGTQYTGYLQKFNVNPASSTMHSHEYMANVQAAASESVKTYTAYKNANALSGAMTFLIPVYEQMPNDIPTSKLAAPVAKATANNDCSITLNWNAISGADKYEVYLKTADGSYRLLKTVTTNNTTIGGAVYGKSYTYKVRAVYSKNSAFTSDYSAAVTATNTARLQAPTLTTSTNADLSFKLSWTAVTGADTYEIYGASSTSSAYRLIGTTKSPSFTTGTAAVGVTYSYKARALKSGNSAITSAYSTAVSTALSIKLTPPVLNKITVNNNCSFTLSWNAISGADKYEIYLKTADGSYRLLKTVAANSTTIGGAVYGKEYTYKIKAINSKNTALNSDFSNIVSATNNKKLQTPSLNSIKVNNNGGFEFSWNAITGADKYEIYYDNGTGYKLFRTITDGTSFTTSTTVYGKKYSFKAKAISTKNSNITSDFSNVVSETNNKKLQTPTNVQLKANSDGSFALSWSAVSGADKYEVYISDGNTFRLSGTVTGTSAKTAAAPYGKPYSYKIKAIDSKNSSAASAFSSAVTGTNKSILTTPTVKLAVNTNCSVTLTWNKVTGADKYEVYLKTADGSFRLLKTATTNSTTIGGAVFGKEYTYKVRALNTENSAITSAYSSEISGTNNKKLQTPTLKASVNANGGFAFSWNAVGGADKYEIYYDNGAGYKLFRTATGTSVTTSTTVYGKKYSFKIRAVKNGNSSVASAYSAVVSLTNTNKLQIPSGIKLTVNKNASFTISWAKTTGADKYEIYLKTADDSYRLLKTVTTNSTTIGGAVKGKKYTYKIKAVNSKNSKIASDYTSEFSGVY